ncbi:ATP-binding protein, partial [Pseudonocardia hydrocarbonoxydans]|uniref:ATP-binding protein n=1 Tax=Pseudonocardia hydrocarbonoxydans TaxID=76726 RepID=UPI0031D5CE3D
RTAAALRADPLDEQACRGLMQALRAAGDRAAALRAFDALRRALAAELGVDPAPATRELHAAVLAEDRGPAPPTELTGRAVELSALRGAWSRAAGGSGGLVLVAGEGGIGKTRLAAELAEGCAAGGARVLRARCYTGERSLFLQPVVDALAGVPGPDLRELAGRRAGALAGLLAGLDDVPEDRHDDPAEQRRRVCDGLARVLCGLAGRAPVLLLLDDVHNAGLATVELLHVLARRAAAARLLVVAVLRAEEGRAALDALADVATRVDLGPLDDDAVARLADRAGHGGRAAEIAARTRGHTLFVVETLRALDTASGDTGERGVPESLQEVVLARLRRAGPECEEVLRAGAVLGATVDPERVAALLDLAPLEAARRCQDAADARLLVAADRTWEFVNDLVQEVLYATTPGPLRTLHHRRAADLLTGAPEAVAMHARAAGDLPRAARAFLAAGERAVRAHATADAETLLGHALDAADRAADRELLARAHLARGRAREALARYRDAMDDFAAAARTARLAGDRRLEMRALRDLGGHAAGASGSAVAECARRVRAGLVIAESLGAREDEADLLGWLTVLASSRLRFADAVVLGERAVRAGRAARSDRALAAGLDGLKNAHAYLGDVGPLRRVLDELEPLLRRLDDTHLLAWTVFESAFPALAAADWTAAGRRIDDAVAVATEGGYVLYEAWFVAHRGWMARLRGDADGAVALGRRAVALTEGREHAWFVPAVAAMLGTTLLECGDRDGAVAVLGPAAERAAGSGAEAYRLRPLAALAQATGSAAHLREAATLLAGITAPPGAAWMLGAGAGRRGPGRRRRGRPARRSRRAGRRGRGHPARRAALRCGRTAMTAQRRATP